VTAGKVTNYLDRMRAMGTPDVLVEMERDAWILIAVRWPEKIAEIMVEKVDQLDDPLLSRLYRAIGALLTSEDDSKPCWWRPPTCLPTRIERVDQRGTDSHQ
jgi:hypothetical protein